MSNSDDDDLTGLRVLLVEDEALVSMLAEGMLEDLGCIVVGPAMRVREGLDIVGSGQPLDAAVLDVNVRGETAFAVAEALRDRGVPFAFATGYGGAGLTEAWRDRPVLQKPYSLDEMAGLLRRLLAERPAD